MSIPTDRDGADYRLGLVLVSASALAWSLAGFFTRLVDLDVWTMLAWRGLFGAAGIGVFALAAGGRQAWRDLGRLGGAGWLYAGISAVGMILFIASLRHTSVAHVAVIYATVPFVAAVLGWIVLREVPTARAVLASLAALAGVVAMVGLGADGGLIGDALAFGMTAAVAAMMVIARRFQGLPGLAAAWLSTLVSGLACWPLGHPGAVTGQELGILALFGLVNSALGLALFTLGARRLPAMETALIGALDAPLAPLWVWLAFGERPDAGTLAGGAVVFAAVGAHLAAGARSRAGRRTASASGA